VTVSVSGGIRNNKEGEEKIYLSSPKSELTLKEADGRKIPEKVQE